MPYQINSLATARNCFRIVHGPASLIGRRAMREQLQCDRALALLPMSSHMFTELAVDRAAAPQRNKILVAIQGGGSS